MTELLIGYYAYFFPLSFARPTFASLRIAKKAKKLREKKLSSFVAFSTSRRGIKAEPQIDLPTPTFYLHIDAKRTLGSNLLSVDKCNAKWHTE